MAHGSPQSEPLPEANVSPSSDEPTGRAERLWRRLPRWVLALPLITAVWTLLLVGETCPFRHPPVGGVLAEIALAGALFVAGAVKRLRWKHVAVMFGLSLVWLGAEAGITSIEWSSPTLFPWLTLLGIAAAFGLIGFGEAVLAGKRHPGRVLLVGLASVCGAGLYCLLTVASNWTGFCIEISTGGGNFELVSLPDLMRYPLLALIGWTLVPLSLSGNPDVLKKRWMALGTAAACVALACFGFFHVLAYSLSLRSMTGTGPLHRGFAARILHHRGRESDYERIWRAVEDCNWERSVVCDLYGDWRFTCVNVLADHDPSRAAERLSRSLLKHPTPVLAWACADVLAAQGRYETAPILLRYALYGRWYYSEVCLKALEDMRVPHAAMMILRQVKWRGVRDGDQTVRVTPGQRARLTRLLGCDVGSDLDAWVRVCAGPFENVQAPLTASIREKLDAVTECVAVYQEARQRWFRARGTLARRMMVDDGMAEGVEQLQAWYAKYQDGLTDGSMPEAVRQGVTHMEACLRRAEQELGVAEPDWNVPTTAAFREEVEAYTERVDARIGQCLPEQ